MKKFKVNSDHILNQNDLKSIFGGDQPQGPWVCVCNSGARIGACPDCSHATCNSACVNQEQWTPGNCVCAGSGC